MRLLRHGVACGLAVLATGLSGCGGDGIVLPNEAEPAKIEIVSGNGQSGPAGAALGSPLVVLVTDTRNAPVKGQDVSFAVDAGGGQVQPATTRTDAQGHASATWTLGAGTGLQRVLVRAVGDGVPDNLVVTFNATATSGSGSALQLVSGDGQSAAVGSALPDSLVVKVVDGLNNPVGGVAVTWSVTSGGGSVSPETVATDANGLAAAERVLGPAAGSQSAQAAVEGLSGSPVTFTHTAVAANPTDLLKVSGDDQVAPAGFELTQDLVVQLVDDNDNGVGGKTITWVVAPGSGSVSPQNSTTDPNGFAATRWTLGPVAGTHHLNAVFSGLPPVSFSATATSDVPTTIALNGGNNQTGLVGNVLPAPLSVKVTDAKGNPVEGVTVTWTANDGGSVSSPTSGTNASGVAQVNRTLGATPGSYGTVAEAAGLTGSPVTFTSTATIVPTTTSVASNDVTALFGQNITFTATVTSNQGVPTGSVQFTIDGVDTGPEVPLSAGKATMSISTLPVGTHLVTARYLGAAAFQPSADPSPVSEQVSPANTSTALISNNNPAIAGEDITFTATVSASAPGSGIPTGNVEFRDGSTVLGTVALTVGPAPATASLTVNSLATGGHTIRAEYQGSPNFNGSISAGLNQTVNAANAPPTGTDDGYTMDEDEALNVNKQSGVLANDTDPNTDQLTAQLVTGPTNAQSFTLNSDGSFSYTPNADFSGQDTFIYQASDGRALSGNVTVTITVNPVNDAPSFQIVDPPGESGTLTVSAADGQFTGTVATSISVGPANESSQTPTFDVQLSIFDALLFSQQPTIDANGTLTFTPNGSTGSANVTVRLKDNGGTSNGGQDTSAPHSFTIQINP